MKIWIPDPEFAETFRSYRNYLEDMAGSIGGAYGLRSSLVEGVHDGVLRWPPVGRVQRRRLTTDREAVVSQGLRKSWGTLQRLTAEVNDPDGFDEEANAWIPTQAYYAVYHATLAYAAASGQAIPRTHAAALKLIGTQVERGLLPYPWSVACSGCPIDGTASFVGFQRDPARVHVLSSPDPDTAEDRLAMFLRTTRKKELDRRFADERTKRKPDPGRTRRNLSKAERTRFADTMAATTVFDLFWRLRKKANYDDADVFVLGAAHELDAHRFGASLAIVTDATVAALEALIAAAAGPRLLHEQARSYQLRKAAAPGSAVGLRVRSWETRASRLNALAR